MKSIYSNINILALCWLLITFLSCSDNDGVSQLPKPVPLEMKVNSKNLVMGDQLQVTISVDTTEKEKLTSNEEFDIYLSALSGLEDLSDDIFEDFPKKIVFPEGGQSVEIVIPIKKSGIDKSYNIDFSAFVRGYKVKGATQSLFVSDYHYVDVSIKNNTDKEVTEGDSFILSATLPNPASEDVKINISAKKGQIDKFENLPEYLLITKGELFAESNEIRVKKDGVYTGNEELTLLLNCESKLYPLASEELVLLKKDIDAPLGAQLEDERWVYNNPNIPFVSMKNKDAVLKWYDKDLQEIKIGDSHPKLKQWKFFNALEFHHIPSSFKGGNKNPNQFGNHVPWCFAAQNTIPVQQTQGVNNEKYSTITEEGYLKMWCVKEHTVATGGASGYRDYGTAAFFSSKFNANNSLYAPQHTRIFPGMRIEIRARIRGAKNGFNAAIWLQGISQSTYEWPKYGEIDVLENPSGPAEGKNSAYQTFHLGENGSQDFNPHKKVVLDTMDDWNIYWIELEDESTVNMGINGQKNITLRRSDLPDNATWPFDKKLNPEGLYFILTLAAPKNWALGPTIPNDWDLGFANITYTESKVNPKTPRMEVDWVRFYTNDVYDAGDKKSSYTHKDFYFY